MADDPLKAPNDGAVRMPSVDNAMNKVGASARGGGKGSKRDAKDTRLGAERKKEVKTLERARKRMDRCIAAESDNRKAALDDLKFYRGDQWPADVLAQRNFDNRPTLTINKLPTMINQVTNDVRQNRPSINVSPVGDKSDPEVAKMFAGMIREIERKSAADIAYDTAFASATRCGFGAVRVITEYEKPNSLNQVATIKRIRNPFTVYFDPAHQEPDGSDAKYCFITEMISRSEFEEDYPDADPVSWTQAGAGDAFKNWIGKDEVRVAEYFEIENEKRTYVMLENGAEGWLDEMTKETLEQFEIVGEREADVPTVVWYKLTATEILEERKWPGKWIPVVKVIGDEVDVEGKPFYWGLVRFAKDAQRMFNYWRASFTENVALAPKAPFIMAEGQDEGYEAEWKNANIRSYPVLHYRPMNIEGSMAPPPQRQAPVPVPQGLVQAANDAAADMMATTGVRFDATPKERLYDESGRALRELRKSGDLGSFHLVDNLARSLRHIGEILVDLIPKLYDRKRVATILREDDAEERVMIDPSHEKPMGKMQDPATGKTLKIFNPTYGEYGVTVTIGPSYATKRIEAAESMMDFMRALAPAQPAAITAIMDLVARSSDWPGADQIEARLAKVVAQLHPGIMDIDMKDIPPQVQALISGAQAQVKQLGQEKAQLTIALNDRNADRALEAQKNEQNFEAKLLAIAQKQEASINAHIGAQLKEVVAAVQQLHGALSKPAEATVQ